MHRYKDLKIWQAGMEVAKAAYDISAAFPPEERFGITAQIRRAAVSIPSNIAEGAGRNTNRDFSRFVDMSMGSCNELQTHLILCIHLGYINKTELDTLDKQIEEIKNMSYRFKQTLD